MMALSLSLLQGLTIIGFAAAQNAYLYNLDIKPRQASSFSTSSSIDSETADTILTRRLGAGESTKLGRVDDVVLEYLNNYGGQRTLQLFGDETSSSIADRLIVAIEGYDGEPLPGPSGITIKRADTNLAMGSFMRVSTAGYLDGTPPCTRYIPSTGGMPVTYVVDSKGGLCMTTAEVLNMLGKDPNQSVKGDPQAIQNALNTHGGGGSRAFMKLDMTRMAKTSAEARNAAIKATFTNWYQALERLAEAGKVESTILLLPSQRAPPKLNLNLNRRQVPEDEDEEPLSQPFVSASASASQPSTTSPDASTPSNSTHPLPPLGSFLPACFPDNSTCKDRTNMCSGHGFCYAKSSNCFTCKCGSTIMRQDSDGKNVKTVQWGGTACERKDVSVPFFLFAGFGIFMTAVVVGVIGMMYSMGSEELPSVIGAGVTGPRAQR